MAEPRRAARIDDPLPGARILVVEARFYDAIGAMLLELRDAVAMLQFNGATPPQRKTRPVLRVIEGGLSRA